MRGHRHGHAFDLPQATCKQSCCQKAEGEPWTSWTANRTLLIRALRGFRGQIQPTIPVGHPASGQQYKHQQGAGCTVPMPPWTLIGLKLTNSEAPALLRHA